jgi:hypothetical protein
MPQPTTYASRGTADAQLRAAAPTCGGLLARLSELDRWGFDAQASTLRDRLRAVVRERPLDEVYTEIVAVRDAADALGRTS